MDIHYWTQMPVLFLSVYWVGCWVLASRKDVASPVRRGWVCSWRMLDRKCQKHIWNSYIQEVYAWQRRGLRSAALPARLVIRCYVFDCHCMSWREQLLGVNVCRMYRKHEVSFGCQIKFGLMKMHSLGIYSNACVGECVTLNVCECKTPVTKAQILLYWTKFQKETFGLALITCFCQQMVLLCSWPKRLCGW